MMVSSTSSTFHLLIRPSVPPAQSLRPSCAPPCDCSPRRATRASAPRAGRAGDADLDVVLEGGLRDLRASAAQCAAHMLLLHA